MVATLPGRTQGLGLITEPLLADLHLDRLTYASINFWATLIGAAFCPVEPAIDACVLTVPGGKLAQFAGSVSSLATPFLTAFAATAGIPARTCNGGPAGAACAADDECNDGECCQNESAAHASVLLLPWLRVASLTVTQRQVADATTTFAGPRSRARAR